MIEKWVEQCRKGQTRAYASIVQTLRPKLLVFLYRMTQDLEMAEDLGQEAFLKGYRLLDRFDSRKGKFSTWLFTIARNLCLDELRKRSHTKVPLDDIAEAMPDHEPNPQAVASDVQMETKISEAVRRLEVPFREVFVLREYEQLSVGEIAEITGVPEGTVKSRLYRARLTLQEALAPILDA